MKKHNPKVWRMCGQHISASDDNCTDLKRHAFTEWEYQQMQKKSSEKHLPFPLGDCQKCKPTPEGSADLHKLHGIVDKAIAKSEEK